MLRGGDSMKSSFAGILGLIALVFGLITYFALPGSGSFVATLHFIVAVLLLSWFFFAGGLKLLGKSALKRAAGFGAGVTFYSGLFFALLILCNFFVYNYDPLYYDSTEQSIYTLAPQSKKTAQSLKDKIIIRGFYVGSRADANVLGVINRLLRETDKIEWRVIDPITSPQMVERFGISEKGTLHFSFADSSSSREVKIARNLDEQGIVNAILKLTRSGEKKVYWLSGHGEASLDDKDQGGYLFLKEAIQGENVVVEKLELAALREVPEDATAILLMAPRKSLVDFEVEAIKSYLAKGGNALFLNEPRTTGDVASIVKPFGIKVGQDIVMDEVVKLLEGKTLVVQPMVTEFGEHPITQSFKEGVIFGTSSSVRAVSDEKHKAVEIAFTSKKSWAEKNIEAVFSEPPTAELEKDDMKGPVPVAVASEGSGRVVVIGDADFVANVNIRHLFNRDFFLNSFNWVLGDADKISIRAATLRGSTKPIQDSQLKMIFLFTGILLPELLILFGIGVWWFRR